ncbi:uncharacterized protein [Palaemon carinicauda]|uniref:uncharacterized protein n=1 Tax=Palaemon carinicauda TaxID=392227 RepID=UPI0035B5CF70
MKSTFLFLVLLILAETSSEFLPALSELVASNDSLSTLKKPSDRPHIPKGSTGYTLNNDTQTVAGQNDDQTMAGKITVSGVGNENLEGTEQVKRDVVLHNSTREMPSVVADVNLDLITRTEDNYTQQNSQDQQMHSPRDQELNSLVIRKCCALNELLNSKTKNCTPSNETSFDEKVKSIVEGNSTIINYELGKKEKCFHPYHIALEPGNHTILPSGHLKIKTVKTFEPNSYCIELYETSTDVLLVASSCHWLQKCRDVKQFDYSSSSDPRNRMSANSFDMDPKSPKTIKEADTFIDGKYELCSKSLDRCFTDSLCCKDSGDIFCRNSFQKCCQPNEIWSDKGCTSKGIDYMPSDEMSELLGTYIPQTNRPKSSAGKDCNVEIRRNDTFIPWRVQDERSISVNSSLGNVTIDHYCVDDYKEVTGETESMIILCLREVTHILPPEFVERSSKGLAVGKCCPEGQYLNGFYDCVSNKLGLDIIKNEEFVAGNVTEMEFTDRPLCYNNKGPTVFVSYGKQTGKNYFTFNEDNTVNTFFVEKNSIETSCINEQIKLNTAVYCIDYAVEGNSTTIVIIFCDNPPSKATHQEKFVIIPIYLAISCIALCATAFFLAMAKVRRPHKSVRKINTLPGRILMSYVMAYLMSCLLLIILLTGRHFPETCFIISGLTLFFSLASFLWNTSIAMESLLLSLDVSMSENYRFLCHSLWVWGAAGIITAVALALDHYRQNLPCSVIRPKFGEYKCFFSDDIAQVLYLYLPMSISILANIVFLAAGKLVRWANIKRLEQGYGSQNTDDTQESHTATATGHVGSAKRQHSGLRKYEQNNPISYSVKLIFWAGLTWICELIAFLYNYYIGVSEMWYTYLLYINSAINSLRGVGIFFIIVLTSEHRKQIYKKVEILCPWVTALRKLYNSSSQSHGREHTNKQSTSQNILSHNTETESTQF